MKVFITRELPAGNPLRENLEHLGFQVTGISLLSFRQVNFVSVPDADWLFFYSKNAVTYFKSGLEHAGLPWPKAAIAAMGPGTGRWLQEAGHPPDFIGSGMPEEVAPDFLKIARNKTVLFPRAEVSKESIRKLLHHEIIPLDLVVYANQKTAPGFYPAADIYVFTSSLNVEAFCDHSNQDALQAPAVAIGRATAGTLAGFGWKNWVVSKSPDDAALLECILSFTDKRPN